MSRPRRDILWEDIDLVLDRGRNPGHLAAAYNVSVHALARKAYREDRPDIARRLQPSLRLPAHWSDTRGVAHRDSRRP